jgi:hypothetical protein
MAPTSFKILKFFLFTDRYRREGVENGEGGFNKPSLAMAQDLIHIPCPGLR